LSALSGEKFLFKSTRQTMNANAHCQKGNNPAHKLKILKMFIVKNGKCKYFFLGNFKNRSILVAGILDRRNPLKNEDNRIYEIWLCVVL